MALTSMVSDALEREGYALAPDVIDGAALDRICENFARFTDTRGVGGVRRALQKCSAARAVATSESVRSLVCAALGAGARPVRSLFFHKSPHINWAVAWHQDRTIAVKERADIEGFSMWTQKDGVWHVQPPAAILRNMLTVRVHLDAATVQNGALRVLPGSHKYGILSDEQLSRLRRSASARNCIARRGDVLLMRPLLAHSSLKCTGADARRVLHIEYAAEALPAPLEWG